MKEKYHPSDNRLTDALSQLVAGFYLCNACPSIDKCTLLKTFYDAEKAHLKSHQIEVNHELIRRVLPKGSSFDDLTQKDITRMMNHINSYKRKKLNNRSPYETFSFYFGEETLKRLGFIEIIFIHMLAVYILVSTMPDLE